MKKFNDWIDSLSNWAWLAVLLGMVMAFEYVVMGGLQ